MNKFTKFYDTPKLRVKMVEVFQQTHVSIGATGGKPGDDFKWAELSLRITDPTSNDVAAPRYVLRLDRDTAARVVESFTAYLAEPK